MKRDWMLRCLVRTLLLFGVGCSSTPSYMEAFSSEQQVPGSSESVSARIDPTWSASLEVLSQQGFVIQQSDPTNRIIRATREVREQKDEDFSYTVSVTITLAPMADEKTKVMVAANQTTELHKKEYRWWRLLGIIPLIPLGTDYTTAVVNRDTVREPQFYQRFFAALKKSLGEKQSAAQIEEKKVADLIFHNGDVVTADPKQPQVEALAVKDGKILAVGEKASVMKTKGPNTTLIDLQGHTLMPGFVEAHTHILGTAIYKIKNFWCDLSSYDSKHPPIETLKEKLKECNKTLDPKGEQWLLGFGVDPSRTDPFMASLNKEALDDVTKTTPIFVMNASGHIAYVNQKAFDVAGITKDTPNPEGGEYVRDKDGKLTGQLNEEPAFEAFAKKVQKPDRLDFIVATVETVNAFAVDGITTATDLLTGAMLGVDKEVEVYKWLAKDSPVRMRCYISFPAIVKEGKEFTLKPNSGNDMVDFIGIKFTLDGSTQGLTAALKAPYGYPQDTTNQGRLNFPSDMLYLLARPFFKDGWQLSLHANGDRATEMVLDVYEKLLLLGAGDRRFRIEHFTVTTEEQVQKVASLGVTPSMTIGHVYYWGQAFHDEILKEKLLPPFRRASRIDPTGDLVKRGVRFSLNSDSPVSPAQPLRYIQTAMTRVWQASPQDTLGPEQRLTVDQAIRAVTLDAAYQLFMDHKVGSLEVGKLADLVVLDKNPRTTDVNKIAEIKVMETYLEGKKTSPKPYPSSGTKAYPLEALKPLRAINPQ